MVVQYNIPWDTSKDLVSHYTEVMESSLSDWVCFLDADAMFTTYSFGKQIEDYIKAYSDYGCFVAKTNRIGGHRQREFDPLSSDYENHDIIKHRRYGNHAAERGLRLTDYSEPRPHHFSGVCVVLSKKAYSKIEGFRAWKNENNHFLGVDSQLHQDLYEAGVKTGIMESVYVYHYYRGQNEKEHLNVQRR